MEVTIGLLKSAMQKAPVKSFLIDGFPRALDQLKAFTEHVQEADFVLFFECPLETMAERLLERGLTSGRGLHSSTFLTQKHTLNIPKAPCHT